MARLIEGPVVVEAAGLPPKRIEEFVGRARTGTPSISIARMKSPPGWSEPGQTPEFDEFSVVLAGMLNAVRVLDRRLEDLRVVVAGAGACARTKEVSTAASRKQRGVFMG